jgi:hypothetical protein
MRLLLLLLILHTVDHNYYSLPCIQETIVTIPNPANRGPLLVFLILHTGDHCYHSFSSIQGTIVTISYPVYRGPLLVFLILHTGDQCYHSFSSIQGTIVTIFNPAYRGPFLLFLILHQYWPGSRAERPILSSAPRGGGDGDPPCALASRRWGPIYIASYTHTLGSWDDFL